jgi:hypothetical protein
MAGSFVGGILRSAPAKQPRGYPSPWDLPQVSEQEVEDEMAIHLVQSYDTAGSRGYSNKPASPRKPSSPRKKIPRRGDEDTSTDDSDYMMTGGLH